MKHLSIVQHTQSEWLGHIEDHLEGRGIRFGYHRPFASGGSLPSAMTVGDGLVMIGGGPLGTASTAQRPAWLEAEIKLARACLMMGKPVIGIGLGSQVLSLAADGGSAEAPFSCFVGMARRACADALAGRLPEQFPFVHYGRDRPVPPDYATILARDDDGLPAIFQIGRNAFGFIGHLGLRPAMIEDLIMEFDEAPEGVADQLALIKAVGPAIEDALVPIMTGLVEMTGWMRD